MHVTEEQRRVAERMLEVTTEVMAKAQKNARFHERMLRSDGPDVDHRYHAGAIDAYVAVLKACNPNLDWLSYIRATAFEDAS